MNWSNCLGGLRSYSSEADAHRIESGILGSSSLSRSLLRHPQWSKGSRGLFLSKLLFVQRNISDLFAHQTPISKIEMIIPASL